MPSTTTTERTVAHYSALEGLELFVGGLRAQHPDEAGNAPFDLLGDLGEFLAEAFDAPLHVLTGRTNDLFDRLQVDDPTPQGRRIEAAAYLAASRVTLAVIRAERESGFLSRRAEYLASRADDLLGEADRMEREDGRDG